MFDVSKMHNSGSKTKNSKVICFIMNEYSEIKRCIILEKNILIINRKRERWNIKLKSSFTQPGHYDKKVITYATMFFTEMLIVES